MFIAEAYAQTGTDASDGSGMLFQILPLVLIFVVFYFLLIRPQQKRMKDQKAMLAQIRRGDRVVTGGGIIGTVQKAADDELTVEIAEGVRVRVLRGTVSTVLQKTEPVRTASANTDDDAESTPAPPAVEPERKGLGRFLPRK